MNSKNTRFWEIDTIRGIAIILMISFHFIYDLNYFHYISINLYTGFLLIYVYFVATIFLILVGISLTLSYSKVQKTSTINSIRWKFFKRGFFIFSLGLLITFVTWIYLPRGFIVFGILHCIGVSIILAYPFIRYTVQPFFLGIVFIAIGIFIKTLTFDFSWLVWLGFTPSSFYTVDYFPLFPWFGVVFIGISLGNTFYKNGVRKYALSDKTNLIIVKFITFLGKHSLIIYLLHQVILFEIFALISYFNGFF